MANVASPRRVDDLLLEAFEYQKIFARRLEDSRRERLLHVRIEVLLRDTIVVVHQTLGSARPSHI
jgi:hypothetical protein